MESEFSYIGVDTRVKAITTILDYVDTTYLPETVDRVIHALLHQQMLHTLHDITDKLLHGGYVVDQLKNLANELSLIPDETLDFSSPNVL
jgi:hypothetical protein